MSKREAEFYFVDIFLAVYKIKLYTSKFKNSDELLDSILEWDATIRELEIIGEAIKNLINLNILENKKFRKIVDFRNVITHGYFGIDEDEVWYVVKEKLDELNDSLFKIILEKNINVNNAIFFAKNENKKHKNIIKFLDNLHLKLQIAQSSQKVKKSSLKNCKEFENTLLDGLKEDG